MMNSIVIVLLALYIGWLLKPMFKKVGSIKIQLFLIALTVIHFSAALFFAYSLQNLTTVNDPINFYNNAVETSNWFSLFNIGSSFISFLIFPCVKLGISIEVLFLVFSTISFKGILMYFELIGLDNLAKKSNLLLLFYLTPSFHFWTGFLGKEALLLWLMVLLLKKVKMHTYDWWLFPIGGLLFLIRPHVFFVLLVAIALLFFTDNRFSKKLKMNVVLIGVLSFVVLVPVFLKFFLRIETLDSASIQLYVTNFLEITSNRGNTAISLTETTIFTRIFYLVLMPLPFLYDIKSTLQWVVAIENLYFLGVLIVIGVFVLKNSIKKYSLSNDLKFAGISAVLLIILFGSYLYNLGLGNRMRIMFFPYLFYFLISTMNEQRNTKIKTQSQTKNLNED